MNALKDASVQELAEELLSRPDLRLPNGLVKDKVWTLRTLLGSIACVDGVLIREAADGRLQGGVINRGTGRFAGKLALVGGVTKYCEHAHDAIRRHYKDDLGFDVEIAFEWCLSRDYAPQVDGVNRPGFCHDPGKHSAAKTFVVRPLGDVDNPIFGTTLLGGQEATKFEWFYESDTPGPEHWAYDMQPTFIEVMRTADALRKAGIVTF